MSIVCSWEKKNSRFNQLNFAKLISKMSKTQVIIIKNYKELGKYFKRNLISDEIIIGMGQVFKTHEEVKNYIMSMSEELAKKYNKNLLNNIQLSNYSWFNLGGPAEYFFKPENKNN